jgi:hypothetical protein
MSIFGNGVNDDIFTPEYNQDTEEDEGQVDNITDNSQQDDLPPEGDEGQGNDSVDETEGDEQGDAGTQEPPKKLAGKFDNPEKLENSYLNLQVAYTKAAQEISRLKKAMQSPQDGQVVNPQIPNQQPIQASNQYPDVMNQMINAVYERVYAEVVNPLNQQLVNQSEITNQLMFENKLAQMATKEKDFQEVAPIMLDMIQKRPELMVHEDFLDIAYTLAQKQVNEVKATTAVKNARKEAYQSKEIKVLNNNNAGYIKNTQQNAQTNQEDDIRNAILGVAGGNSLFKR